MRSHQWLISAFAILTVLLSRSAALASNTAAAPPDDLSALDGEWIYVEDRTEGRTLEQLGPPMASKFSMRVEDDAVFLTGHGSGHRDVRIALDGSVTEIVEPQTTTRYRGTWNDGVFDYEVDFLRGADQTPDGRIRRRFQITPDGLLVSVTPRPDLEESVGLYRHAEDIPLPTPAKAAIGDMAWLAGAWVGKRSSGSSIEERWSPPLGGSMLAVSRTVNTSGRLSAFEYLRILERDGGLVYTAQPGGAKGTEFVLTELTTNGGTSRAVFDNPRHDYPKRIVYELSSDGALSATIGFTEGGTPRKFDWKREGE